MNTHQRYEPPDELNTFSINMTINVTELKKVTLKVVASDYMISWGDSFYSYDSKHKYNTKGQYIITINGCGLTELDVRACNITNLKLDSASDLLELLCGNNPIHELKLSNNTLLKKLDCYGALLEKLDVHKCSDLELINCGHNYIKTLNANDCKKLRVLMCYGNELKSLNIKGCEGLRWINCSDNKISKKGFHDIINSLPSLQSKESGHICIGGNEEAVKCEIGRFNQKCWNVDDYKKIQGVK